jgi:hypothetical protein
MVIENRVNKCKSRRNLNFASKWIDLVTLKEKTCDRQKIAKIMQGTI